MLADLIDVRTLISAGAGILAILLHNPVCHNAQCLVVDIYDRHTPCLHLSSMGKGMTKSHMRLASSVHEAEV